MKRITFVLLLIIMALTSSNCVTTPVSYLVLFVGLIYSAKIEYGIVLSLCANAFFYRIPTGMPISPLFFILPILNWGVIKYFQLKIKVNLFHIFLLLLSICYIYYSCYTSLTHSFDKFPMYLLSILFIFAANNCKKFDFDTFEKLLLIALVVVILYVLIKLSLFPVITEGGRRKILLEQNGNVLARNIAYFSMATLYLIRIHNIKWLYVFYIFSCIAILFIGSRTSFFGMILVAYLMTIYFSNNKKHFFKKTFVYLIVFLILYLLSSVMNSDRVTQISIDDINDDIRLVTATYLYNFVISRNLWTGIGLGNENTYEVLGYVYDSDNMYIDILSQIGLFGLFVVLFLVIYTLLKIVKLKNKYVNSEKIFFPLSLIILNMSTSMTESIFDESFFYTSIGIAYIYINNLKRINSINMYKKL